MNDNDKILLLIDFDGTIIDGDIIFTMFEKTLNKEDYKSVTDFDHLNYGEAIDKYYKLMSSYNKTTKDINPVLEQMKINEGIPELFKFIRDNKNKFFLILITGDDLYTTTYFLKFKGFFDLFDYLIGIPSDINNDKENKEIIKVNFLPNHDCEFCDESLCKTNEFLKFLEKNEKFKNNKIYYICDGWNDFCLSSKYLRKNDFIFIRDGCSFSKLLKKEKYKDKIKSNIYYWKNGFEIIDKLKSII
jgi:2-hydroxy-3-keto-5-methylthiopentenyl-1-phosphate phosphatase